MSKKSVVRIILSILGLALGIVALINNLRLETPNYVLAAIGVAISLFSIGWLFNLKFVKIVTGIFLIPTGLAGSLWTIWDFIQDILFDKGVIGNFPLLGYNMTIFLVPYIIVFALFCWILIMGIQLLKGKKIT